MLLKDFLFYSCYNCCCRKPNARKWFFSIDDWQIYEEIEDLDQRVPSMFEEEGEPLSKEDEEEEQSVQVCKDNPQAGVCPACHDTFSQFYHQDKEEWHYKNAIQVGSYLKFFKDLKRFL